MVLYKAVACLHLKNSVWFCSLHLKKDVVQLGKDSENGSGPTEVLREYDGG